jgi:hypothetical protein
MKRATLIPLFALFVCAVFSAGILCASAVAGPTAADKCQAAKLRESAKLSACLLGAESKAVKKGTTPDPTKCLAAFAKKWGVAESRGDQQCPTVMDEAILADAIDRHRAEIAGRLAGGYGDLENDFVELEIPGVYGGAGTRNVVMVQGPGVVIDRIEGFDGMGRPEDSPGFSTDIPMIFEHVVPTVGGDPGTAALAQAWAEQQAGTFSPRSASVILRDLGGTEVARWNVFEIAPVEYSVGTDGRDRYKWQSQIPSPTRAVFEFAGGSFDPLLADDFDVANDNPVEIEGIGTYYVQVSDDVVSRKLTLRMFYDESQNLYQWVDLTRDGSSGYARSLSVLTVDPDTLAEVSRRNYFGTFPLSYRLVSGLALPEKTVIEIVLSYNFSEEG